MLYGLRTAQGNGAPLSAQGRSGVADPGTLQYNKSQMLKLGIKLGVWSLVTLALSAQTDKRMARTEEKEISANPRYSSAFLMHKRPEDLLSEVELKLEEVRSSEEPEFDRFLYLPSAAKAALEAGQNDKAKSYAEEALEFLEKHREIPPSSKGNAVFYCNLVLGRLALLRSDTPQAEEYLLLSGRTPGSPSLDTFGPNMSLAPELLKRSCWETVLRYLQECGEFWFPNDESGRLTRWSDEVQAHRMPVFGTNLFY